MSSIVRQDRIDRIPWPGPRATMCDQAHVIAGRPSGKRQTGLMNLKTTDSPADEPALAALDRLVAVDELFHPATLETAKI